LTRKADDDVPPGLRVLATRLRFPEGPVWMKDGSVLLVEIARGAITRVSPGGAVNVVAHTGGGPNGMAVGPDGAFYICNNGGFIWREEGGMLRPVGPAPDYTSGRIQRVDSATGETSTLYDRCGDHPLSGPNDLVFDRHGGFYFTDTGRVWGRTRDNGSVYYALADGSAIREIAHPVMTPNGIGLSPDGAVLYVAEMETARLWAYDIIAPGELRKQPFPVINGGRLVIGLGGFQRLDSLAVAASGNICMATLVTGCVTVVSPQGELLRQVKMPEMYCTNICFGGSDLRTAYITLSLTGQLVALDWPEAGLPLAFER
jgi:gluconolactonase